jgi:hypothetical protein
MNTGSLFLSRSNVISCCVFAGIFLVGVINNLRSICKYGEIRKVIKPSKDKEEKEYDGKRLIEELLRTDKKELKNIRKRNPVLKRPVPPYGIKDIFLSNSFEKENDDFVYLPTSNTIYDLILEVKSREKGVTDLSVEIKDYNQKLSQVQQDISLLNSQLEAEEQLRGQAEAQYQMMAQELERLNTMKNNKKSEKNDLIQQIRQTQIELIQLSSTDTDESMSKVEKIISEMQDERARMKTEVTELREKSKKLLQKSAHFRQDHIQQVREIAELKAEISLLLEESLTEHYNSSL